MTPTTKEFLLMNEISCWRKSRRRGTARGGGGEGERRETGRREKSEKSEGAHDFNGRKH